MPVTAAPARSCWMVNRSAQRVPVLLVEGPEDGALLLAEFEVGGKDGLAFGLDRRTGELNGAVVLELRPCAGYDYKADRDHEQRG